MNEPTIAQVDAAVRSVLSQVSGKGKGGDRTFAGKLLAARHLEGWTGSEIRVEPGTVVTPLAKDQLKRMGVILKVVSNREIDRARDAGEWGFAMEAEAGMVEAVRRKLLADAHPWREVGTTALQAGEWVGKRPDRGAAVITREASVACYLANRVAGVRAATFSEAEAISRAIPALGVNLAVIEPMGTSIFHVMHLLTTFRRGGAPSPPDFLAAKDENHADRRGDWTLDAVAAPSELAHLPLRDRIAHAQGRAGGRFDRQG